MSEQDAEARIGAEVTRQMEIHNVRQASSRLADARVSVKNLRVLDLPDDLQDDLDRLVLRIEDSEWHLEQYLLAHR